jgi:hypothetical protein
VVGGIAAYHTTDDLNDQTHDVHGYTPAQR